jgi:hypothetical protein
LQKYFIKNEKRNSLYRQSLDFFEDDKNLFQAQDVTDLGHLILNMLYPGMPLDEPRCAVVRDTLLPGMGDFIKKWMMGEEKPTADDVLKAFEMLEGIISDLPETN